MVPIVDLDQTLEVVAAQVGDGLLFTLLQVRHLAAQGEEAAPALLVKLPRVRVLEIDVGLIAFHHPLADLGKFDAAVLHSAVGRVDAVFQFKLEILGLAAAPDQKCVVPLQRLFRRALADDGFVLHTPENGIAVPSLQALAVEDGFEPRVVIRRQGVDARPATAAAARLPLRRASLLRAGANSLKGQKRSREQSGGGNCNKLFHKTLLHELRNESGTVPRALPGVGFQCRTMCLTLKRRLLTRAAPYQAKPSPIVGSL